MVIWLMNDFGFEFEVAKKAIIEAGETVMRFYGSDLGVLIKENKSFVTKADLVAEKILLEALRNFGYGLLSEESEDNLDRLKKNRVWLVDPLDGTNDFIQQTGDFTLMVSLVDKGEAVLGLVYQPVKKRLFYATRGFGAFVEENGKVARLRVSERDDFVDFRLLVSRNHLLDMEIGLREDLGVLEMITCGSAGLKASLIAFDKADLYLNTSDKTFEWDVCAGEIIVREAGGMVTDMNGRKIVYNKQNPCNLHGFVVSNARRHQDVVKYLQRKE